MLARPRAATERSPEELSPQLDDISHLSIEVTHAAEQYLHLRSDLIRNRAAFHTTQCKRTAAESTLFIREDPLSQSLIQETPDKLSHLEQECADLTRKIKEIDECIHAKLRRLTDLANALPELDMLPYKVKPIYFDIQAPRPTEQSTQLKVQDLLSDLIDLEDEVLTCARQFPATLFASTEQLALWGVPEGANYADLLELVWPKKPKVNEETGEIGAERTPQQIQISSKVGDVVATYKDTAEFKNQLIFEVYLGISQIMQAKGLLINVSQVEGAESEVLPKERAEILRPIANDYGQGLLNTVFANHLLARRQERTCTLISESLIGLHRTEQQYWLQFCSYVSHIFHYVQCLRTPGSSERDKTSARNVLADAAKQILEQTEVIKKLDEQHRFHYGILLYGNQKMQEKLVILMRRKGIAMSPARSSGILAGLRSPGSSLSSGLTSPGPASPSPH
jgi:hypothetical protein